MRESVVSCRREALELRACQRQGSGAYREDSGFVVYVLRVVSWGVCWGCWLQNGAGLYLPAGVTGEIGLGRGADQVLAVGRNSILESALGSFDAVNEDEGYFLLLSSHLALTINPHPIYRV